MMKLTMIDISGATPVSPVHQVLARVSSLGGQVNHCPRVNNCPLSITMKSTMIDISGATPVSPVNQVLARVSSSGGLVNHCPFSMTMMKLTMIDTSEAT